MIPETHLLYNYDYAKRLYRGTENFEDAWRKMLDIGAGFEKVYEEAGNHILELIEKYSGYPWEEHCDRSFPIYLIVDGPSFSYPFSLEANEDAKIMLEDYVKHLVRCNMHFGFASDGLKDRCLQIVTDYVLIDLGMKKLEDKGDEWDLTKQTIKQYLKK